MPRDAVVVEGDVLAWLTVLAERGRQRAFAEGAHVPADVDVALRMMRRQVDRAGSSEHLWGQEPGDGGDAPMLMTSAEIAELLQVDPSTVRRWIRSGRLRPATVRGRSKLVDRADVRALQLARGRRLAPRAHVPEPPTREDPARG